MILLESLKKAFLAIITKPIILFSMLIATLASIISMNITNFVIERPLSEMLYHMDVFMTSDLIAIMLDRYLFELIIMLASGFIVFFISIIAFISLARFAKGESFSDAINNSVLNIKKSLSLTFFIFVCGFVVFIIFQIILFILNIIYSFLPEEINYYIALFIFPILMIILIVTIFTKIVFVVPALIENNIRDAIKKSWEFTNERFWNSFLYIIIVFLIGTIVLSFFNNVGILLNIGTILTPIGEIISMTFIGLALSYYYFN
jgi:hypothetical protein